MSQTQANTGNLSNISTDDKEIAVFIETIVRLTTGYSLSEVPDQMREKVAMDCLAAFNNFILKYIEQKFEAKDSIRLKANQKFPHQDIFTKFADLGPKFDEAFEAYVDTLAVAA